MIKQIDSADKANGAVQERYQNNMNNRAAILVSLRHSLEKFFEKSVNPLYLAGTFSRLLIVTVTGMPTPG